MKAKAGTGGKGRFAIGASETKIRGLVPKRFTNFHQSLMMDAPFCIRLGELLPEARQQSDPIIKG